MKRIVFIMFALSIVTIFVSRSEAILISQFDFASDCTKIDFENVENNTIFGNAAFSPILDYQELGVTFVVHNAETAVGTVQDVFRLGGWVDGHGTSIATNVGENTSIELIFDSLVYQIGGLVAISNARLSIFGNNGSLLEEGLTQNAIGKLNAGSYNSEYIGIERNEGISRAIFTDITGNGLIMSIDDVQFTFMPVPEPSTLILLGIGIMGLMRYRIKSKRNA